MSNRGPAFRQGYHNLPSNLYNMLGLGVLSLRYAARGIALTRTLRYQQCQPTHLNRRDALRTFSTTPRRQASEVPDDFIDAIKHTELFKKLADKPKALKALSDLYDLTKEMGACGLSLPFQLHFFCSVDVLKPHLLLKVLTSIP